MPKLKRLSGKQVVQIFSQFDFVVKSQRGSHIKLQRFVNNAKQSLTIPAHSEIDTGTLKAILRQATQYISMSELQSFFYTD